MRRIEARVAAGLVSAALLACGGPRASPPGRSSPAARATPLPTPTLDPARPLGIDDPTIPQIIAKLSDPDPRVRWYAARHLGARSAEAVPALVASSRAEDAGTGARLAAFEALATIPDPSGEALRRLAEGMADPSPQVRKLAAEALSGVGPGLASVLDILAGALEHPQASARRSAASLLASAGPAAAAAVPALYGALRDEDAAVREEARRAIRAVRGQ